MRFLAALSTFAAAMALFQPRAAAQTVDELVARHIEARGGYEKLKALQTIKITLKVRTKSGAERVIYLDVQTYLERRQTGILNLPGGRQFNIVLDLDNYRDVNGVRFPFDINEDRTGKEPAQSHAIYTEKIEVNVPLDDALFMTPVVK